jgi:methylated-DNA-[protein]-cysteine S-methyltransferase
VGTPRAVGRSGQSPGVPKRGTLVSGGGSGVVRFAAYGSMCESRGSSWLAAAKRSAVPDGTWRVGWCRGGRGAVARDRHEVSAYRVHIARSVGEDERISTRSARVGRKLRCAGWVRVSVLMMRMPPSQRSRSASARPVAKPARVEKKQPSRKARVRVSDFQRRVYALLSLVPRGCVVTYQELARALGCGSPRAVGRALRANPWAPRVPCHRVIASDLRPGGYQGKISGPALRLKLRRLAQEGVRFHNGRLTDPSRLFHFRNLPTSSG